jgi:hypothetical protein
MTKDKRKDERRKFGYYMRVTDNNTHETVGYLSDVSRQGFKLESQKALQTKIEYNLRLEMTYEIAKQPYIVLVAQALWSQPDPITPNEYIEGFKIVSVSPHDEEIFQRIVEKYGKPEIKP